MLLSLFFFPFGKTNAQNLPTQMHFSADGKRLITGGVAPGGLYDEGAQQVISEVVADLHGLLGKVG